MSVYKNGNIIVSITDDGTKIRYSSCSEKTEPQFPESMDVKITNRCSVGCPMCHERSVPDGAHADLNHPIFESMHPYTELAIGGGDPMMHPDLEAFLHRMKEKQVICNITVHQSSFCENYEQLKSFSDEGLIHGLGVSINDFAPDIVLDRLAEFPNAVVHCILGIADSRTFERLSDRNLNMLLLGYKMFGRGVAFYNGEFPRAMHVNLTYVRDNLEEMLDKFRVISFDNLAIKQLYLKEALLPHVYDEVYMGGDGEFTMYLDMVKQEYAMSSISNRHPIDSDNIDELFAKVRMEAGHVSA